jgi:hypothetical protein
MFGYFSCSCSHVPPVTGAADSLGIVALSGREIVPYVADICTTLCVAAGDPHPEVRREVCEAVRVRPPPGANRRR